MPSLLNLDSVFAAAIAAEERRLDEMHERERMGPFLAFIPLERARRFGLHRNPFHAFGHPPALVDWGLLRKGVIVDHDGGDGTLPPPPFMGWDRGRP